MGCVAGRPGSIGEGATGWDMENVWVIKQLSASNWEFEFELAKQILGNSKHYDLKVVSSGNLPIGRNNKNRHSDRTLVAVFSEPPKGDIIADMRWAIHNRHN